MTCNQHQQIGELFLPIVRDVAEYKKWMKWHDGIKKELKKLISEDAELDKTHHLGKKMSWGRLDNYRPDLAWKKNNKLSLFEVEYYYNQDKIVRDIMYARLLDAEQMVFIFSDKRTNWGDGKKRVEATHYLTQMLFRHVKPLHLKAISIGQPEELEEKLKQLRILQSPQNLP